MPHLVAQHKSSGRHQETSVETYYGLGHPFTTCNERQYGMLLELVPR